MVENANPRGIRDDAFARRLNIACDGYSQVPPLNKGRLTWILREFASRYNMSLSLEAVRKWFSGESRPRPDKMKKLAELLQVDEVWLALGKDGDVSPREQRARNALADGAVNVVAGYIQMGGGNVAFPDEGAKADPNSGVDIYAIIKGARYDIHVVVAKPIDNGLRFALPINFESLFLVGMVMTGSTCCELVEITADMVGAHGNRRGGHYDLDVREHDGQFVTPSGPLPKIESFDKRL